MVALQLARIATDLVPITNDLALVLTDIASIRLHFSAVLPDVGARMRGLRGGRGGGGEDDGGAEQEGLEREHGGTPPRQGIRVACIRSRRGALAPFTVGDASVLETLTAGAAGTAPNAGARDPDHRRIAIGQIGPSR